MNVQVTSRPTIQPAAGSKLAIADGDIHPQRNSYKDLFPYMEQRWVDIYPNKGKRMGAFSTGAPGTHPYVFMSYNNDIFGMSTLAHELGHFRHHHVWKRMAALFAMSLGFLWLLGYVMDQDWFYAGLNVQARSTALALTLFFLVVPVFTFLLHPLTSLYSRKHEYEADTYAARHTIPADLIHALVKLYQDNAATLTPDPLYSAFYDSHPPALLRIARLQSAAAPGQSQPA